MSKLKKILNRKHLDIFTYAVLTIWLIGAVITKNMNEVLSATAVILIYILSILIEIKNKVTEFDIKIENVTIKNINYNDQGASDEQS